MPSVQDSQDIAQKLGALRGAYCQELPGKLAQLDALWQSVRESDNSHNALTAMHAMLHSLCGSGATFGFPSLSQTAHLLEQLLKILAQENAPPTAEQQAQVAELLAELHRSAQQEPHAPEVAMALPATRGEDNRLVYVVDDDAAMGEMLALQLGHFDYQVRYFERPDAMLEAARKELPGAIIMDVMFPEGDLAGTNAIMRLRETTGVAVPVVFLSRRADLAARLSAVRAGGLAYLTKPVDVGMLVDKLDSLTCIQAVDPYRVLVVDDSVTLSSFYAYTLQQAGMVVATVNEPMRIQESLDEFKPELILLDIYMPDVNGMELAQAIRQEEAFISVPIVFLSAEQDLDKQFAAMNLGGDDFLIKPIQPAHLVLSAQSRVERYRVLRSMMVRDSLTGLLNHTKTKEQLEIEFVRAQRHNRPLAFAMVDLDHFKLVNDTYGHPAGDRVIKSLARLLRQRLRQSDIVGRFGGEEFAVILTETDADTAVKLMNDIREGFSRICQRSEGSEFFITFSCGIATLPGKAASASELNAMADRALYQAKHRGRNCVVLAE